MVNEINIKLVAPIVDRCHDIHSEILQYEPFVRHNNICGLGFTFGPSVNILYFFWEISYPDCYLDR